MKLKYLGTAAAEGSPALFCRCEFCKYAWKNGGKEIRTRAGSIIDGRLKLDFGPDTYKHMLDHHMDLEGVTALLITHSHEDHYCINDLAYRRNGFSRIPEDEAPLTIYGNEKVGRLFSERSFTNTLFQRMLPFEPTLIDGYTVTALEAVHCLGSGEGCGYPVVFENKAYTRSEEAFFYLIEKDGKSILYAHDTDEFTPSDMEFLTGRHIDLISLDCTNGRLDCNYIGHMGINDNLRMREKLLANGAADEHTVFAANHFSHNGLLPHREIEAAMPGFVVAYDGMEIEI